MSEADAERLSPFEISTWVEVADSTDEYAGRTGRVIETTDDQAHVRIPNREQKWYDFDQLRNVVGIPLEEGVDVRLTI